MLVDAPKIVVAQPAQTIKAPIKPKKKSESEDDEAKLLL